MLEHNLCEQRKELTGIIQEKGNFKQARFYKCIKYYHNRIYTPVI